MSSERLNVIALISGGKDSFFSVLHCMQNGHRVVALANLFPKAAADDPSQGFQTIDPAGPSGSSVQVDGDDLSGDLNSFMYQTVGHEIIPLYAAATGLPLYRQPITGGSVRHERDYDCSPAETASDETESMVPLLKGVMQRHPEANALCAGAILSTFQRTRVESVALRLGLTPLAYLWKYPILPHPGQANDDAQLLKDMANAGLEARIIKVASAGLDEDHLWDRVTSNEGAERVKRALRKFGAAGGAVLGEGGEFETIVVDGPSALFKKRITVPEESKKVVREGGGSTWLLIRGAGLEDKPEDQGEVAVSKPDLFEPKFQAVLDGISDPSALENWELEEPTSPLTTPSLLGHTAYLPLGGPNLFPWAMFGSENGPEGHRSMEAETIHLVEMIRERLDYRDLDATLISHTIVVIRRMSDFPTVNAEYGKLFSKPNPPARVTISCGDLLPPGSNIAIFVSVSPFPKPGLIDRQGLHVQSRSYWAPANIGPYSQAVGIRVICMGEAADLRTWSIAGQIPLIPGAMELPAEGPQSSQTQVALSLQHLWRIASDVKIQFWTSAVAFFCSQKESSNSKMPTNAKLAGLAWKLAHGSPDDDEETESGPDPWDLKYNPQYMSLGGEQGQNETSHLPDWDVLIGHQPDNSGASIPPCFAVEVEELPRQSQVEWHAHVGLSQLEEGTLEIISPGKSQTCPGWTSWCTVAQSSNCALLHTVVARDLPDSGDLLPYTTFMSEVMRVYSETLIRLKISAMGLKMATATPYLTYMNPGAVGAPWTAERDPCPHPLIPCRSVWTSKGKPLAGLSLYRQVLQL